MASAHPKLTCVSDTDGDGVLNHLDLDSDGDGCSDAMEGGATSNLTANYIFTGPVGTNGLDNSLETADNGVVNYTSTYNLYAINASIKACTDTDGDGIVDIIDIDDDNDGVLDVIEMGTCTSLLTGLVDGSFEEAAPVAWNENTNTGSLNSTMGATGWTSTNSPDTWTGGFSLIGSGFWGGAMNGVPPTPDGNVFAAIYNGFINEAITKSIPASQGIKVGHTYTVEFYQIFGGVNGLTPVGREAQLRFTFDGVSYLSNKMTYNGNNVKQWEKTSITFTATTNAPVLAIDVVSTGDGNYIGVDGIVFYEQNTQGCGGVPLDTDNDGIPNYLDLDSDGDGCPDTKEAILYNHITEASIAADVKNGSGGAVTSTVNMPNAMVPGPYGSNGFADALQLSTNPDAYKYIYTYLFVATNADVSTCSNKFLYDIDSDDDGIPDAVESPSCFYTEAQAMDITEGVTSDFGWTTANPLSKTYDDITLATNYGEISAPTATSIQNKALITFNLPVIDAAFINSVTLNVGSTNFGAGKWKLQGLDMMTNTWMDLSASAGQALNTTGNIVFNNTLQNNTRYYSYRILGVDNVNIVNAARLIEFTIQYKNYNASYHRTKMGCSSDADGDGVPNYIDRDSDGDGCPDAVEAGIPLSKLVPGDFFNIGGVVSGNYVTVGGNYGDNGLGDTVETAPDSGIVNYTSTYTQYATNKTLNFCTDTDGDSVPDLIDLDDDNDGILDTTECVYPAIPTTTSTADIFATWSNTTTAAGTNGAPTYLTSVGSWTAGAGLTAAISGGVINISNVNGSTLGDAFGANEYLEHPFTTTADNYNSLYYIRSSASNATNYHWAMLISDDNFVTYTILNIDMLRNATGVAINDINDYQLKPSTAYKVRTYYWGAPAFTFDEFTMFGYSECDTDSDGVPNRLDLDSDGDGCPDAKESGVAANSGATASMSSSGGSIYTGGIASGTAEAYVGNGTPAQYGNNGFFNGIETAAESGLYNGTYTYASAINATISACFCYKTPAAGTALDTHHGITSLQRAGTDNSGWPMVRKGAWTALESKTKAFVPNRLTITEINSIPVENLKEGMMVYNISSNCIYINTDGTANGWKCFNTQACP